MGWPLRKVSFHFLRSHTIYLYVVPVFSAGNGPDCGASVSDKNQETVAWIGINELPIGIQTERQILKRIEALKWLFFTAKKKQGIVWYIVSISVQEVIYVGQGKPWTRCDF